MPLGLFANTEENAAPVPRLPLCTPGSVCAAAIPLSISAPETATRTNLEAVSRIAAPAAPGSKSRERNLALPARAGEFIERSIGSSLVFDWAKCQELK